MYTGYLSSFFSGPHPAGHCVGAAGLNAFKFVGFFFLSFFSPLQIFLLVLLGLLFDSFVFLFRPNETD
jgi:hypothetical protein